MRTSVVNQITCHVHSHFAASCACFALLFVVVVVVVVVVIVVVVVLVVLVCPLLHDQKSWNIALTSQEFWQSWSVDQFGIAGELSS